MRFILQMRILLLLQYCHIWSVDCWLLLSPLFHCSFILSCPQYFFLLPLLCPHVRVKHLERGMHSGYAASSVLLYYDILLLFFTCAKWFFCITVPNNCTLLSCHSSAQKTCIQLMSDFAPKSLIVWLFLETCEFEKLACRSVKWIQLGTCSSSI